ncbi:potassium channel subfamily K member 1-like [Eucyclogobius newberryi]|uniref:potassium channel subfamily K member 1-like n=1 Tax=Eucyclogobius newberryi TaxID=166745 RepID=UPI003B5A489F
MSCGANAWCARFVERRRAGLNFAALVLGYVLYLIIGAGIFSAVELPYEVELRQELRDAQRDFLRDSPCVDEARLEELLARVLEASNYGVTVLGNGNGSEQNWDFVSSLFFTSTVLTTTGYGHTVPLSDEGKAFCIFYSVFGIPLTLLFLSAVVQRIMVGVTRGPIAYFHRRWATSKSVLAVAHAVCMGVALTLLLLIIPSWILVTMEKNWNFLESFYFCFISLTTIGLGDYVPGSSHKEDRTHPQLYRLGITVYLLVGLIFMLVMLETCCELPQMRRLRQRFYNEDVHELHPETATIIDRDQLSEHYTAEALPTIPSVSEQAASMKGGGGGGLAYSAASVQNGKLR